MRTPNPPSGQPLPGTPKPTSATGRAQSSSAKPLLRTETTRVLRPRIKALLDGDRPVALPRLNPLTPPTEGAVAPLYSVPDARDFVVNVVTR